MNGDHVAPGLDTDRDDHPPRSRWQDLCCCAGILIFCLVFVYIVAVLPIQLMTLQPLDPAEAWGTEGEAVTFATQYLDEHLGRTARWQPTVTMQLPEPSLDQGLRLWIVTGEVAIDQDKADRFQITVCKTSYGWARIRLEKNGRQLFYDDRLLVPYGYEFYDDGTTGSFMR